MSGYFKRLAQATFAGSTVKNGLASHFSRQAKSAVTPAWQDGGVWSLQMSYVYAPMQVHYSVYALYSKGPFKVVWHICKTPSGHWEQLLVWRAWIQKQIYPLSSIWDICD